MPQIMLRSVDARAGCCAEQVSSPYYAPTTYTRLAFLSRPPCVCCVLRSARPSCAPDCTFFRSIHIAFLMFPPLGVPSTPHRAAEAHVSTPKSATDDEMDQAFLS